MEQSFYTIGRLAGLAGVGVETVRYYQRRGLLRLPAKGSGAYRRYDRSHVATIRFIRRAQSLGFSLSDVEALLQLADGADRKTIRRIAGARLEDIRARIADLQRMATALTHALDACETAGATPHCPIVQAIAGD